MTLGMLAGVATVWRQFCQHPELQQQPSHLISLREFLQEAAESAGDWTHSQSSRPPPGTVRLLRWDAASQYAGHCAY